VSDAAVDLGASKVRAFFDIELPLIQDGVISAFLLSILLSINEAARANVLGGSYETISGVIYGYYSSTGLTAEIYTLSSLLVLFATILTMIILLFIGLRMPTTAHSTEEQ